MRVPGWVVDLFVVLVIAFFAVYVFGESVGDVLKDFFWFYTIMSMVVVTVGLWMARSLTKAMNPVPIPAEKDTKK